MTILERNVSRTAIEASVRGARYPGHDPARWALPLVAETDRVAGGVWTLVALDEADAAALWLPPHAGEPCHGDTRWLGGHASGLTLGEAAAWLQASHVAYASSNRSCWERIVAARETTWGPIVVAPFPVGDRTAPSAAQGVEESLRIVIDGLHRALGWAIRDSAVSGSPGTPLLAYLAGPDTRTAG